MEAIFDLSLFSKQLPAQSPLYEKLHYLGHFKANQSKNHFKSLKLTTNGKANFETPNVISYGLLQITLVNFNSKFNRVQPVM